MRQSLFVACLAFLSAQAVHGQQYYVRPGSGHPNVMPAPYPQYAPGYPQPSCPPGQTIPAQPVPAPTVPAPQSVVPEVPAPGAPSPVPSDPAPIAPPLDTTAPAPTPGPELMPAPTPAPAPEPGPDLAQSGAGGTGAPGTVAPNMHGDLFGFRSYRVSGRVQTVVLQNGASVGIDPLGVLGVRNLALPSPTGGVAGLIKISEDNNPLPRDRVFVGYDYFNDVPIASAVGGVRGVPVHRFSPGIEKTFFNQRASLEVRVPIASTIPSDTTNAGDDSGRTELGNVRFVLKGLLIQSQAVNVAGGLGISIPTADDIRITDQNVDVLVVRNETVLLTPFMGVLLTPSDRLFMQATGQYSLPTNGNPVDSIPNFGTNLIRFGRLTDQNLFQLDVQLGYWLVKPTIPDPCSCNQQQPFLAGLAPFFEVHYNTAVGGADRDTTALFNIAEDGGSGFNELNLTVGLIAQLGTRANLSLGASFPVVNEPDRTFDYQVGLRFNIFYGGSADARRGARVSSF